MRHRQFALSVIQDALPEDDETVVLSLSEPVGAELGARTTTTVTIVDDDPPTCLADTDSLCLNQSRFRVEAEWRTSEGAEGRGQAFSDGDDVGSFWFFSDNNLEVFVKILNGCGINNHRWVFAAATTDVEYTLRVTDTQTGQVSEYFNPLGNSAAAITDTMAFATCP